MTLLSYFPNNVTVCIKEYTSFWPGFTLVAMDLQFSQNLSQVSAVSSCALFIYHRLFKRVISPPSFMLFGEVFEAFEVDTSVIPLTDDFQKSQGSSPIKQICEET